MFKRRDIPPVLLLLLLIILVMLTLSQILVVHNGRYGRNVHSMRKLQLELREMDVNLHALMMQNVPSIELNRRLLQNEINAHRFAEILSRASQRDPTERSLDLLSASRLGRGTDAPDDARPSSAQRAEEIRIEGDDASPPALTLAQFEAPRDSMSTLASPDDHHHGRSLSVSERTRPEGERTRGIRSHPAPHSIASPNGSPPASDSEAEAERRQRAPAPDASSARQEATRHGAKNSRRNEKTYCPSVPPSLRGNVGVSLENASRLTWDDVADANPDVHRGGAWSPTECVARHRVAIIVPYRDREQHLITLLYYLHPVLQRQQLDYRIYVVEQYGKDTFNKARIMNIAFVEALKQYHFQCFVFHDVDLVPEDDRNMYSCPQQPRHMSVAIDEMGYKLAYQELVGGVLNMRTEHFQRVNGYSNLYWGWGAEDDDMAYRIMHVGLKITRPPETTARYKMAKHTKRKPSDWRKRAKLLYTGTRRFQFDGLNSLQYRMAHIKEKPLYTHLLVDIGRPPRGF